MPVGLPEFVENPENRCPVVLLLDTSGSMDGEPIKELNRGIATLKEEILKDAKASLSVEVAIVTFGPVRLAQDFVSIDNFTPPVLEAGGLTPLGEAIQFGLELIESRKSTYRQSGIQYYRPWIFLITDGAPDAKSNWQISAQQVRDAEASRRICFFAVAVEGADMDTLRQIAPPERPPVLLHGLDFKSLFVWLSTSMKRVSSGKVGEAIDLPPVGWGKITI